ncbi:unnamed protein product, partial [marine sediment metagenome]
GIAICIRNSRSWEPTKYNERKRSSFYFVIRIATF